MPTACLRGPVPSSVVTRPPLDSPRDLTGTAPLEICKRKGEHKWGPSRTFCKYLFKRGVRQLRQPYVRVKLASLLQELPYALGSAANCTDKGSHHGCTAKVHRVSHRLVFSFSRSSSSFSAFSNMFVYLSGETDLVLRRVCWSLVGGSRFRLRPLFLLEGKSSGEEKEESESEGRDGAGGGLFGC